jgi:hypothetical protein
MKTGLLILALSAALAADPLDEVLAKFRAVPEGRVTFQLKIAGESTAHNSTLVFRRPDRLHYWGEMGSGKEARQVHCWLDQSKLWAWTSLAADGSRNVYASEDMPGGLKDAPTHAALGPANYWVLFLSGDREQFDLDPAKAKDPDLWTAPDPATDQLVLDPATRLLKEIVAWKEGREMARASLSFSSQPVSNEELIWQMPSDSTLMKQP